MLHHVGSNMIKILVRMESCNISGSRIWFNLHDDYGIDSIFKSNANSALTAFYAQHPIQFNGRESVYIFRKDDR